MALTPVKGKKALPLSTSLLFSEHPSYQSDWQIGLDRIKCQYWKGHWKECATLCRNLLHDVRHSSLHLRATCLHFYAAICYDSIGRAIKELSREKLRSLEQARDSYNAAAAALPSEDPETWNDRTPIRQFGSVEILELQTPTKRGLTQPHDAFSPFNPIPQRRFSRESIGALIPSPLHVNRIPEPTDFPITPPRTKPAGLLANVFRNSQGYPPFTPPRSIIPSSPPFSTRRRSITFSASSFQWLQHRSAARYNTHLADFAKMVQDHIAAVEDLMTSVRDIQADRRIKRLASFGEDRETRAADLRERIVRLRAKGWRRERFAPERYQDFCAVALAEL